jgi:chromosome segregation ATPase
LLVSHETNIRELKTESRDLNEELRQSLSNSKDIEAKLISVQKDFNSSESRAKNSEIQLAEAQRMLINLRERIEGLEKISEELTLKLKTSQQEKSELEIKLVCTESQKTKINTLEKELRASELRNTSLTDKLRST